MEFSVSLVSTSDRFTFDFFFTSRSPSMIQVQLLLVSKDPAQRVMKNLSKEMLYSWLSCHCTAHFGISTYWICESEVEVLHTKIQQLLLLQGVVDVSDNLLCDKKHTNLCLNMTLKMNLKLNAWNNWTREEKKCISHLNYLDYFIGFMTFYVFTPLWSFQYNEPWVVWMVPEQAVCSVTLCLPLVSHGRAAGCLRSPCQRGKTAGESEASATPRLCHHLPGIEDAK